MSSSATAAVLACAGLDHHEFRWLIWLAECDGGEAIDTSVEWLWRRCQCDPVDVHEFAVKLGRVLTYHLGPDGGWTISGGQISIDSDAFCQIGGAL